MQILDCLLLLLAFAYGAKATDDGLTTDVTWDEYSLSVKGERVFIFSGEFHYLNLLLLVLPLSCERCI
jgi:hypothetical protein